MLEFSPNKKLGYVPELDGLRSIAVFLVMIAHSNIYFGDNGGIGVDIFFALSGFLITTLILEEKDDFGSLNIRFFYARRFLRLFPALIFLLIVTTIIILTFFKRYWNVYSEELIASFFYVYNISWYWDFASQPFILYHMWSLGVEEQYYIWWPVLILISSKFIKEDEFTIFLLVSGGGIFCFRFILVKYLFFNSIFMDSIFFGSILGLIRRNFSLKYLISNYILIFSLFLLIFFSLINFSFISIILKDGYRGVFGVLTCLVIINIVSVRNNFFINRILRSKLFVFFGRLSYSLYLWHLVVFVIFRNADFFEPYQRFVLKFIISIILASVSYFLVEKKILKYSRNKFSVR